MKTSAHSASPLFPPALPPQSDPAPKVPEYLHQVYWWAYLHPNAVRVFERKWLVNLILWGNFNRLRDAALTELGATIDGAVLQVACVYGDFTQHIAARLGRQGTLDVVDVAPIQLQNLQGKLASDQRIALHLQDASALRLADASFDTTLLFFLLHEQPDAVRRATLAEALRVTRPGGKVVIVDYHNPRRSNPLRYLMAPVLRTLEPFALELWQQEIADYLPSDALALPRRKTTYFGELYQKVVLQL